MPETFAIDCYATRGNAKKSVRLPHAEGGRAE
jgi:hypothetical protein